jgi:hypothetical protein
MTARPSVGSVMREGILGSVLFPALLRPMMPRVSPRFPSKEMSHSAQGPSSDCGLRWGGWRGISPIVSHSRRRSSSYSLIQSDRPSVTSLFTSIASSTVIAHLPSRQSWQFALPKLAR